VSRFFRLGLVMVSSVISPLVAFADSKGTIVISPCRLERKLEVLPPKGYKINLEGPWSIQLISGELKVDQKPKLSAESVIINFFFDCEQKSKYEVTAYFCDGDKCIREVMSGEL
jgi:hypothetical protein